MAFGTNYFFASGDTFKPKWGHRLLPFLVIGRFLPEIF
jgi:hypothetical protein